MTSIPEELTTLFNLEHNAVLTNSPILNQQLEEKRESLKKWGAQIVPEGLELLRYNLRMAGEEEPERLARSIKEVDWDTGEELWFSKLKKGEISNAEYSSKTKINSMNDMPSNLLGMGFHLWVQALIVPIKNLGILGEQALIQSLMSRDYQISCLACNLIRFEDFNHLKNPEMLLNVIRNSNHTAQKMEFAWCLYTVGIKNEFFNQIVPNLIPSTKVLENIFSENDDTHRRSALWSLIGKVILWDIATNGKGPSQRWPAWWQ